MEAGALPGRPRWAMPAIAAVAGLAALLYAWNLGASDFVPYYSGAARSMSESWRAFLFGAFDPASSITIDKIPGFLWPQALAARLLGFHAWALTLPQVVEGVITVLVLHRAVRRWVGDAAAVLAAAILVITPVVASMFGHAMEDGALTMCLVLAAGAWMRAVETARLRALALAGVWVGAGFQAKMAMAWVVLPAFALVYLVAAPATLRRRLAHLAVAGLVAAAVSASWMLVVGLTPAADRPYVDGTTSNDVFGMVLGYNAADRFGVHGLLGALRVDFGQLPPVATGWFKLLDPHLATQIGWLYPLALIAIALGLWERRGRDRTDLVRAALLMWALWLAVTAAIYSAGVVLHTTYMAALAPPIAALGGYGIVRLVRERRAWALPAAAAVTLAWAAWLAWSYAWFLPWLVPAAAAAGALGLVLRCRGGGRLAAAGTAFAVAAMLAAPAGWAVSTVDPRHDGSGLDASAGPGGIFGQVAPAVEAASVARIEGVPGGGAPIGVGPPTPAQRDVLTYLDARRGGATYLVATRSVSAATLYIRVSGMPVLLVGGFSGRAPYPTPARFRELVADGQLRAVLAPPRPTGDSIDAFVRASCRPVRLGEPPAVGGDLWACGP